MRGCSVPQCSGDSLSSYLIVPYTQDTVPDLAAGGLSLVPEEGGAGSPWVSLLQRNAVNPLVSEESGQVSSALQSPAGGLEVEMRLPSGLNDLLQKPPSRGTLALQARCRSLSLQKGSCFLPVAGWQSGSLCSRSSVLIPREEQLAETLAVTSLLFGTEAPGLSVCRKLTVPGRSREKCQVSRGQIQPCKDHLFAHTRFFLF